MTELRTPPARRLPDLEAEQEVDLGRYWSLVVARWWLPLAGLVIGVALGYLTTLGGNQVYQAKAVVYLGQPQSPTSSAPVQSLQTNPATVSTIVHSESAIQQAARTAGMKPGSLRGNVSSAAVSGSSSAKTSVNPLVAITVKGSKPRKVAAAANALAAIVVDTVSAYADQKIASLQTLLASENVGLKAANARISELERAIQSAGSLSQLERLILVTQLGATSQQSQQLTQQQTETRLQLTLAQQVEKGRVVTSAAPVKTTAKSRRNSIVVGGLIGLIVGVLGTLLWDRIAERAARRPAL